MKRLFAIALTFPLSGCAAQLAGLEAVLAPPYVPVALHVYDEAQYDADNAECGKAGAKWKPTFDVGDAINSTVTGATSNTSLIPVSPLVPAYGAAGGLAKATADGLDFASSQHANVYRNCLHDETQIDRSAVVADPTAR